MFNERKWGKLFYFIALAIFPGAVNAALPSLPAQGASLYDACSHLQEPAEAWRCRALLISQRVEQRQRYLHFYFSRIFSAFKPTTICGVNTSVRRHVLRSAPS